MTTEPRERLARLPQVDAVVRELSRDVDEHGHRVVTAVVREVIGAARDEALAGRDAPSATGIVAQARAALRTRAAGGLRSVLNATGVVLHTNLGRAPLSDAARAAVQAAAGYTNLEYDLVAGERGSRTAHLGRLAAEVCGAEAATVVNNGAAALLLALAALAAERDTVVSRGELVEIGGSYRLPEVMAVAGTRLVEVGTTNRTRIDDYRRALGEDTAVLLKVHRSNFAIVGFTAEAGVDELAELARGRDVVVIHDAGSGLVTDAPASGALSAEPNAAASLREGADLVVFSGDKLLGGPQAGIIVGREDLVERCRHHPLARAVRVDKLQRAALEATLAAHLRAPLPDDIPALAMLGAEPAALRERAERIAAAVGGEVVATRAVVGGGTTPGNELDSWGVRLADHTPEALARRLREGEPAVVGRVEDRAVLLDVRTVPPHEDDVLVERVVASRG